MKFKKGDKVSFLSERREGVVNSIINHNTVGVLIEDGFEIPVLENEIIKVHDYSKVAVTKSEKQSNLTKVESTISSLVVTDDSLADGLYLAYALPKDKTEFDGKLSVYLINHTKFEVIFMYALKENEQFVWKNYDRTNKNSKFLMATIEGAELNKWTEIHFNFMFFKAGSSEEKPMIAETIKISNVRFYKKESYKSVPALGRHCILTSLEKAQNKNQLLNVEWKNEKIDLSKGNQVLQNIAKQQEKEIFPEKFMIERGVGEIDLHIQHLVDSTGRMDASDMLRMQINYFIRHLELAMSNKLHKIIVIHGVGNGVLKTEVRNIASSYDGVNFADASIHKYGVGATEIFIEY